MHRYSDVIIAKEGTKDEKEHLSAQKQYHEEDQDPLLDVMNSARPLMSTSDLL